VRWLVFGLTSKFPHLPASSEAEDEQPEQQAHIWRNAGRVQRSPQPGGALDFPGPAGGCGGRMVRTVPRPGGVTRGHLPAGSPLPGLSVKVRGGGALEVKVYRGSPGILEVARRARGRMESWQKWCFPFSPLSPGSGDPPGWTPVAKRRRISRFSSASRHIVAPTAGLGQPRCEVELTEVHTSGQHWWTLGFEATGPDDLLRSELQATAALVFAHALPGVEPGPDQSRSYAQWLGQRPGAESDAGA
jgi:hypothetical protein